MKKMTREEYKALIKARREEYFKQPYELVYDAFITLGYNKKDSLYFQKNASYIVEQLREVCWDTFKPAEKNFTTEMLCELIDENLVNTLAPKDAITWYAEEYADYIYDLTLSNTQSRRSRAGKEFEAIIELILVGSGVQFDSQGNVGKQTFVQKGLGKLVDVVTPGVVQYIINKRNTVLISAKTTLRERWQEVPEEMGRTGAREMFLVTLDKKVSDEVFETLYEANIQLTATEAIKKECYPNNHRVLSFEELIEICRNTKDHWRNLSYKPDEVQQMKSTISKQIEKHEKHPFVKNFYEELLYTIEG